VIIPTYNRAGLLAAAIDSVLDQELTGTGLTPADIEIIVADDGSTDATAQVVARYGARVRYLALPHRGQPAAPRNGALAVAQGEFVALLDSDDLFLPQKFALQLPALRADPSAALVYSDGRFFIDDPTQATGYVQAGLPTPSGDIFGDLLRGNFLAPPVVLIRRAWLDKVGHFDESAELRAVEDYDLWLRLAIHAPARFVPGEVAAIRRHPGNISADAAALRSRSIKVLRRLDAAYPAQMRANPTVRHEAYARHHGAVALAAWQGREFPTALHHARAAARHALRLPGGGLGVLWAWLHRRRLRRGIRGDLSAQSLQATPPSDHG
jgi:glycosyltransferase involved in cell wall biosynthesis